MEETGAACNEHLNAPHFIGVDYSGCDWPLLLIAPHLLAHRKHPFLEVAISISLGGSSVCHHLIPNVDEPDLSLIVVRSRIFLLTLGLVVFWSY